MNIINIGQRNLYRGKLDFIIYRRASKGKLKRIKNYYLRSRSQIHKRILKSSIPPLKYKYADFHDISFTDK
jgi:hypothetical protein